MDRVNMIGDASNMSISHDQLAESFFSLSEEGKELYLDSSVPVLESVPTPLEFLRNWVNPNKPVKIKGAIDHWPALRWWSNQYLRDKIGNEEVTVAVTPNGYADAVFEGKFVEPQESLMTFNCFLNRLEEQVKSRGIYYVQKQNSNFTDEFVSLMGDAEPDIAWATEAFGKCPDAVNFWMGDQRAVTSMHKDPYENLYCVVSGHKIFTLLPPTDQPFVPYGEYEAARYHANDEGEFEVIPNPEGGKVPWIPLDPLCPDLDKYPNYSKAHPVEVVVMAGETLYLPSLWFHHVQQSHGCIAVNYWYDMEYDIKYNYFTFVEKLLQMASKSS